MEKVFSQSHEKSWKSLNVGVWRVEFVGHLITASHTQMVLNILSWKKESYGI